MRIDLSSAALAVRQRNADAAELIERSIERAEAPECRHAFLRLFKSEARSTARAFDAAPDGARSRQPLAGLAVSIKDLFDVRGAPTTAASKLLAGDAPAVRDCSAVARLRGAGAALIGHTNLTEFAYSGIGINPHFGTPVNPVTALLDSSPRIPGGSTSGGAVSVATGAAWAALGSDTGGSIRIPAALQGLVGFKSTQALTPRDGVVALSASLDTACAITRSVRDAVLLHEVLAARRVELAHKPLRALRLGVPARVLLDALDATVAKAFERALRKLRDAGATIVEVRIEGLDALDAPQRLAGILAAEAWATHRSRIAGHESDVDARVLVRMQRGKSMSAADYLDLLALRKQWRAAAERSIAGLDAVVCPTVPVVAPALEPLVADDDAFHATNLLLLRNPSIVNQLDGCAVSIPCHAPDELPVGLMLFSTALRDDALLDAALQIEPLLAPAGGSFAGRSVLA